MRKSRTNANALLSPRRLTTLIGAILLPMALTSCGKKAQNGETQTAQKSEDDFLDKHAKPEEGKYLVAAKPFCIAVANRNTRTLTRYSAAMRRLACRSINLRLLSKMPIFSRMN